MGTYKISLTFKHTITQQNVVLWYTMKWYELSLWLLSTVEMVEVEPPTPSLMCLSNDNSSKDVESSRSLNNKQMHFTILKHFASLHSIYWIILYESLETKFLFGIPNFIWMVDLKNHSGRVYLLCFMYDSIWCCHFWIWKVHNTCKWKLKQSYWNIQV